MLPQHVIYIYSFTNYLLTNNIYFYLQHIKRVSDIISKKQNRQSDNDNIGEICLIKFLCLLVKW